MLPKRAGSSATGANRRRSRNDQPRPIFRKCVCRRMGIPHRRISACAEMAQGSQGAGALIRRRHTLSKDHQNPHRNRPDHERDCSAAFQITAIRPASAAMIARCSEGVASVQRAISSNVRPHPVQNPVGPSIRQVWLQGEGTGADVMAASLRAGAALGQAGGSSGGSGWIKRTD
jgi:hypothetical protein